ncbi:MAG: GntR family transcriptional regulator [Pseudomonadota bacterium]
MVAASAGFAETEPLDGEASRASGLAHLAPIKPRTVNADVYASLRAALMRGQFAAGEVLRIQTVADSLATSTMPVREAFARLTSERALETLPNRSSRVPVITRARLDDLARARALIEGEAVLRAAPRLTEEDLAALRALTERYDAALAEGDGALPSAAADLNHAFHDRLYRAAGSEVLIPIIESLWLQSGPYVRAATDVYDAKRSVRATHHHHAILTALEAGDVEAARDALIADIDFAFALLRKRLPAEGWA